MMRKINTHTTQPILQGQGVWVAKSGQIHGHDGDTGIQFIIGKCTSIASPDSNGMRAISIELHNGTSGDREIQARKVELHLGWAVDRGATVRTETEAKDGKAQWTRVPKDDADPEPGDETTITGRKFVWVAATQNRAYGEWQPAPEVETAPAIDSLLDGIVQAFGKVKKKKDKKKVRFHRSFP